MIIILITVNTQTDKHRHQWKNLGYFVETNFFLTQKRNNIGNQINDMFGTIKDTGI